MNFGTQDNMFSSSYFTYFGHNRLIRGIAPNHHQKQSYLINQVATLYFDGYNFKCLKS